MNPKINEKSAGNMLGLSSSTMRKMRKLGIGPVFIRMNKAIRYDVQDLETWVEANKSH